jgi:penicillin V acylase-like amidase (Ntn superfamily)
MKMHLVYSTLCFLLVCLIPQDTQSCTSFLFDNSDQLLVGNNLDWTTGEALVIVNKRNVSKTALSFPEDPDQPASWTSQYGSVTYTLVGREFPFGGMNEVGLVVGAFRFIEGEYPPPDSRFHLKPDQWMQYQLDNFSTVEEVIASDSQLRIIKPSQDAPGFKFFVSDRMGSCAVIELLAGEMVYYTKETLPVKIVTNSFNTTYAEFVEFWEKDDVPVPDLTDAVKRFITAADMMANYDSETSGAPVDYAFNILSNLTWLMPTQFSIVYDMKNLRIYFNTIDSKQIRYVDLDSFNFSCRTPVNVLDIHEDLSGDVVNNFVDYTYEINRDFADKREFVPDEELDAMNHYPETTVCTEDCFIATAAYGSPHDSQVKVLREFRDLFLLDNPLGKTFIQIYNTYSPPVAHFIGKHDNVRVLVRLGLLPMVGMSWISLKIGFVPTMIFMFFFLALIGNVIIIRKKRRASV